MANGSSTVAPISEAVAEEFQLQNPNVRVTVGIAGTGGGFKRFCAGETDISNASRPIEEDEAAECAANGVAFREIPVSIDGLAITARTARINPGIAGEDVATMLMDHVRGATSVVDCSYATKLAVGGVDGA